MGRINSLLKIAAMVCLLAAAVCFTAGLMQRPARADASAATQKATADVVKVVQVTTQVAPIITNTTAGVQAGIEANDPAQIAAAVADGVAKGTAAANAVAPNPWLQFASMIASLISVVLLGLVHKNTANTNAVVNGKP